jgi:hypothetical protein
MISVHELAGYIERRLKALTERTQTPASKPASLAISFPAGCKVMN